jgi:hypothetical protein
MRPVPIAVAALVASIAAGVAGASGTPLAGSVGPGFTISVKDAAGAPVTHLDAGPVTLTIEDLSDEHDFHLTGPGGVDVSSTVEGTGTRTADLNLVDGKYVFICDAHPTRMHGSFTVGTFSEPTPPPTPPRTKLALTVTNKAVSLRTAAGAVVRTLAAGPFSIKVLDRSKKQNGHLVGAGVNRKTGIAFVGTVTWNVTLRAGTLSYRSDAAKPRLRAGKVAVSSA